MSARRPGGYSEIGTLYAAIAMDPGEGDRVVEIHTGEGRLPLIVCDRADLDVMLGQLQAVADRDGRPIRVVRFTRDGMVGEFRPGGSR